jgi:hypothetical protein
MNTDTINQVGRALDTAFGRPGFTQFAIDNLATLIMLAEAIKATQEQAQVQKEHADG